MKRNLSITVSASLGILLLISACKSGPHLSVQKRRHLGGYYVDWGNGKVKHETYRQVASQGKPKTRVSSTGQSTTESKASADHASSSIQIQAFQPQEKTSKRENVSDFNLTPKKGEYASGSERPTVNQFQSHSDEKPNSELSTTTPEWLIIVLCILLPPVAVYITQGVGNPFWIDLTLAFLGLGILSAGIFGLFWLAAIVYAFVIIF